MFFPIVLSPLLPLHNISNTFSRKEMKAPFTSWASLHCHGQNQLSKGNAGRVSLKHMKQRRGEGISWQKSSLERAAGWDAQKYSNFFCLLALLMLGVSGKGCGSVSQELHFPCAKVSCAPAAVWALWTVFRATFIYFLFYLRITSWMQQKAGILREVTGILCVWVYFNAVIIEFTQSPSKDQNC